MDILAGVLQRDTLAPYLFIIVIDYIMTVTIDDDDSNSGFTLRPARSRSIFAEKIADVEQVANRLLLWEPTHGVRSRGRPAITYDDSLRADTGLKLRLKMTLEKWEVLWQIEFHGDSASILER